MNSRRHASLEGSTPSERLLGAAPPMLRPLIEPRLRLPLDTGSGSEQGDALRDARRGTPPLRRPRGKLALVVGYVGGYRQLQASSHRAPRSGLNAGQQPCQQLRRARGPSASHRIGHVRERRECDPSPFRILGAPSASICLDWRSRELRTRPVFPKEGSLNRHTGPRKQPLSPEERPMNRDRPASLPLTLDGAGSVPRSPACPLQPRPARNPARHSETR